ncbi:nucleotidyltransferase family protein [Neisseria sp. CCUG12390]|uniref:nucleotidyltransferase family protein n=1 Tax=Neisseria sp. CCUG12390 TaxID=3392035 RepID=UPI003A0FBC99
MLTALEQAFRSLEDTMAVLADKAWFERQDEVMREILQRHFPEYAVWVFGSRVKGTARPYSDLDLGVMSDKPLPLRRMASAEEDFSRSDLPYRVDLLDWSGLSGISKPYPCAL